MLPLNKVNQFFSNINQPIKASKDINTSAASFGAPVSPVNPIRQLVLDFVSHNSSMIPESKQRYFLQQCNLACNLAVEFLSVAKSAPQQSEASQFLKKIVNPHAKELFRSLISDEIAGTLQEYSFKFNPFFEELLDALNYNSKAALTEDNVLKALMDFIKDFVIEGCQNLKLEKRLQFCEQCKKAIFLAIVETLELQNSFELDIAEIAATIGLSNIHEITHPLAIKLFHILVGEASTSYATPVSQILNKLYQIKSDSMAKTMHKTLVPNLLNNLQFLAANLVEPYARFSDVRKQQKKFTLLEKRKQFTQTIAKPIKKYSEAKLIQTTTITSNNKDPFEIKSLITRIEELIIDEEGNIKNVAQAQKLLQEFKYELNKSRANKEIPNKHNLDYADYTSLAAAIISNCCEVKPNGRIVEPVIAKQLLLDNKKMLGQHRYTHLAFKLLKNCSSSLGDGNVEINFAVSLVEAFEADQTISEHEIYKVLVIDIIERALQLDDNDKLVAPEIAWNLLASKQHILHGKIYQEIHQVLTIRLIEQCSDIDNSGVVRHAKLGVMMLKDQQLGLDAASNKRLAGKMVVNLIQCWYNEYDSSGKVDFLNEVDNLLDKNTHLLSEKLHARIIIMLIKRAMRPTPTSVMANPQMAHRLLQQHQKILEPEQYSKLMHKLTKSYPPARPQLRRLGGIMDKFYSSIGVNRSVDDGLNRRTLGLSDN
ncbi:MAG: hypothetical protein ACK4M7_02165 [Burkholderiales bacterium]